MRAYLLNQKLRKEGITRKASWEIKGKGRDVCREGKLECMTSLCLMLAGQVEAYAAAVSVWMDNFLFNMPVE